MCVCIYGFDLNIVDDDNILSSNVKSTVHVHIFKSQIRFLVGVFLCVLVDGQLIEIG